MTVCEPSATNKQAIHFDIKPLGCCRFHIYCTVEGVCIPIVVLRVTKSFVHRKKRTKKTWLAWALFMCAIKK